MKTIRLPWRERGRLADDAHGHRATDRALRIGQRRKVLVHRFVTRGTIEVDAQASVVEPLQPSWRGRPVGGRPRADNADSSESLNLCAELGQLQTWKVTRTRRATSGWEFLTDDEERCVSWLPGRSEFIVGLQDGGKYSNRMFYTVMEIRGNKAKTHRNLGTYRRARPAPEHEPDFNYDASKDTKIWLNRTAEAVINRMINQT